MRYNVLIIEKEMNQQRRSRELERADQRAPVSQTNITKFDSLFSVSFWKLLKYSSSIFSHLFLPFLSKFFFEIVQMS